MVDINERAIGLASENIKLNNVQNVNVFKSNIYSAIDTTNKFASIVTNPPIRAGKDVIYQIYDGAYDRLLPGGELWVVIQKKQGAPSTKTHLEELFGNCEVVGKESGYFILKSVR
jgi:16S rRNA (guanine1207-N2)-methyltransferase